MPERLLVSPVSRQRPLRRPAQTTILESDFLEILCCAASRTYYDRKRTEGKTHIQAMLSLARRRLNVLWAMLRDGTTYTPLYRARAAPLAA
jgi:hypothetical protein